MECQRPAGLCTKGLPGRLPPAECGFLLPPGNQAPAGPNSVGNPGLYPVLVLRPEKRLLRHRYLCQNAAPVGPIRPGCGGAGSGGAADYPGIRRLLPSHLLHPQRPRGSEASGSSPGMGPGLPGEAHRPGSAKASGGLRRFECGAPGDRPKKPGPQPWQRRFLRRRAGELYPAAGSWLHRHLPLPLPRSDRGLQLVELPLQRPEKQRRMAN